MTRKSMHGILATALVNVEKLRPLRESLLTKAYLSWVPSARMKTEKKVHRQLKMSVPPVCVQDHWAERLLARAIDSKDCSIEASIDSTSRASSSRRIGP